MKLSFTEEKELLHFKENIIFQSKYYEVLEKVYIRQKV